MDTVTYPAITVADVVGDNFIPVKINVKENPKVAQTYEANWTPTVLFLDADGKEHHRFEGYLPPRDFLAQLGLARAKTAFDAGKFDEASKHYRFIAEDYADTDAAPQAYYWLGVSEYKRTDDVAPLTEAWEALEEKFPKSEWAKKASFLFD